MTLTLAPLAMQFDPLFGATWWEALTAIGTVLAAVVAIVLGFLGAKKARSNEEQQQAYQAQQAAERRRATASLVSAWVEVEHRPNQGGDRYLLKATAFLANESSEPVFDVTTVFGRNSGNEVVAVGPLMVPDVIRVLPAHRTRSWDVTRGILAQSGRSSSIRLEPPARLTFADSHGGKWMRGWGGELKDLSTANSSELPTKDSTPLVNDPELATTQMGDLENEQNPMAIAELFWGFISSSEAFKPDEIRPLFIHGTDSPTQRMTDAGARNLQLELQEYAITSGVRYPAPQVAYVTLFKESDMEKRTRASGLMEVMTVHLTLVLIPDVGWRICMIGEPIEPWKLRFPPGSLKSE